MFWSKHLEATMKERRKVSRRTAGEDLVEGVLGDVAVGAVVGLGLRVHGVIRELVANSGGSVSREQRGEPIPYIM